MKKLVLLGVIFSLSGCGGGGEAAADITEMSVVPKEYVGKCASGQVAISFEVVHTINGGRQPFRVRSNSPTVQIGYTNPTTKAFELPPPSAFNASGDLILTGKDPQFSVRYSGLGCGLKSEGSVTVLDDFSRVASPTYTAEEAS